MEPMVSYHVHTAAVSYRSGVLTSMYVFSYLNVHTNTSCTIQYTYLVMNQNEVRSDANLAGVYVFPEADAPCSHLHVGALSHAARGPPPPGSFIQIKPTQPIKKTKSPIFGYSGGGGTRLR